MDSKKLRTMIKSRKSVMSFAEQVDIPYTTLVSSMKTDKKLDSMPVNNFIKVAHGLGMSADELIEVLSSN